MIKNKTQKTMKKTIIQLLAVVLLLSACNQKKGTNNSTVNSAKENMGSKVTINEGDWVETDLSAKSSFSPAMLKLPKDATISIVKNFPQVIISDGYGLQVRDTEPGGFDFDKRNAVSLDFYKEAKLLLDEGDSYIYTNTKKDGADGHQYKPEVHFVIHKKINENKYIEVTDLKPEGSSVEIEFTEELAKKVYGIISPSIKIKELFQTQ